MTMKSTAVPHINRIGTAVPGHDINAPFIAFARAMLPDQRTSNLFDRMAERSGIAHRFSFMGAGSGDSAAVDAEGFYRRGGWRTRRSVPTRGPRAGG
jgi:hypothetical protein